MMDGSIDRRFMFTQGMSLPLSMNGAFKRYQLDGCSPLKATWKCTLKCLKRALILYVLNFLINQSQSFETVRILGGFHLLLPSLILSSCLFLRVWTHQLARSSLHAGLVQGKRIHQSMDRAFHVQRRSQRSPHVCFCVPFFCFRLDLSQIGTGPLQSLWRLLAVLSAILAPVGTEMMACSAIAPAEFTATST